MQFKCLTRANSEKWRKLCERGDVGQSSDSNARNRRSSSYCCCAFSLDLRNAAHPEEGFAVPASASACSPSPSSNSAPAATAKSAPSSGFSASSSSSATLPRRRMSRLPHSRACQITPAPAVTFYFTHAIPSAPGPVCNLLLTVSVFRSIAATAPSCDSATNAREPSGVICIPSGWPPVLIRLIC